MDPNANLAEQRRLRPLLLDNTASNDDVVRFAELSEALDEWLAGGGFLPSAWKGKRK